MHVVDSTVSPDDNRAYYLNHSFRASPDTLQTENFLFVAEEGFAQWSDTHECFFLKYKRPGEEISVKGLEPQLQKLWIDPKNGARVKEWNKLLKGHEKTGPAIKVWRGKDAQQLRREFDHRIVNTRWHE